jgi:hypothetical protein
MSLCEYKITFFIHILIFFVILNLCSRLFLIADLLPDQPDIDDFAPHEPNDPDAVEMVVESHSGTR